MISEEKIHAVCGYMKCDGVEADGHDPAADKMTELAMRRAPPDVRPI